MTNEFQKELDQEKNLLEENEFSIYIEDTYDTKIELAIGNKRVEFKIRFWFDTNKIKLHIHELMSVTMNRLYTILGEKIYEIEKEFKVFTPPISEELITEIMKSHAISLLKYKSVNAIQITRLYYGEDVGFVIYKNWP